jgi:hypothetical protein
MGRPRKTAIELKSIAECTEAMSELLIVTTQIETLVADRDQTVAKTTAIYETGLDVGRSRKAGLEAALKDYYYGHLESLEKDGARSFQLANGVMGRRANPPRLAPLNKGWTWASILVRLRERYGVRFLRERAPEVDKDLVKAELAGEDLKAMGLQLAQDETFYAEPARLPEAV